MRRSCLLLLTFCCIACFSVLAEEAATIVGTVVDPTGAVVAGAKVVVSNPEKGLVRQVRSNSSGEYRASDLAVGNYVVTAEAPGFRRLERSGIDLKVGQTLRVDLRLSVGHTNETVQVGAEVARVETENTAVSDVITDRQISNLELNGRDFLGLALLVPGASPSDSIDLWVAPHGASSVEISFNGGRVRDNNVEIDGMSNWDQGGFTSMDTYPSVDSIAKFRVTTSNYGAESGKLGSASIEVATKSGTKALHGTAYDFIRNDAFDANDWFLNQAHVLSLIQNPGVPAPAAKSPLKRNDFGYTIGGPVYIPGHYNTDRSKTFFFWSEEFHRYNQSKLIGSTSGTVPTAMMRNGDFSQCDPASPNFNPAVAATCTLPQVNGVNYDTVQSVPGFNAQDFKNATDLLNAFVPLPNSGLSGYITAASENTHWREDQIRIDQHINEKTSAFVRYTHDTTSLLEATGARDASTFDTIKTPDHRTGDNGVLHIFRLFKPTLTNDLQLGIHTNFHTYNAVVGPSSVAKSIDRPNDFVMNHIYPANGANPLLPAIKVTGKGIPFSPFYEDASYVPYENASPDYDFKDDVAWVVGKHTLKFGFYLDKYEKNQNLQTGVDTQGSLVFSSSSAVSTGNALADMFLGRIGGYAESSITVGGVIPSYYAAYGRGHWRATDFEPYFQDDWKATRKLTLNLGLRYYYYVRQHDIGNPPVDANFLPNLYNPALQAQLDANDNIIPGSGFNYTMFGNGLVQCGRNGIPEGCFTPSAKNFGPRFGFAYDPWGNGKSAIRGGYGVFYDFPSESGAEGMGGNPPPALSAAGANIVGYANIIAGALPPDGLSLAISQHQKFPSVQQFSLTVQHEFPGNNLLSIGYVGSLGRHQDKITDLNQIPIGVRTRNAPALAGLTGTVPAGNGFPGDLGQQLCDSAGNCNVQTALIYNETTADFFVPYRGYSATPNGGLTLNPLSASSSYHSLQANFRHQFSRGLTLQAAYTWSHEIDDATDDSNPSGVDDTNPRRWRATGDLNRRQVLILNYVYQLPFFKSSSGFLRRALGGWQISGISSFYTGVPIDFGIAGPNGFACGIGGFSTGIGLAVQCDASGRLKVDKKMQLDPVLGARELTWFDASKVSQPMYSQLLANGQLGMFGTLGRNPLTGPGRNNWDLALVKDFGLWSEASKLQFRFESFNTFNHPQWNGINVGCAGTTFGSSCDGVVNGLLNGEVTSAFPSRELQLALKLIF